MRHHTALVRPPGVIASCVESAAYLKSDSDSVKLRHFPFDGGGESMDHMRVKAVGDDDTSRGQHANTVTGRPTVSLRSISLQSVFEKESETFS
jgi:hypothetical protein